MKFIAIIFLFFAVTLSSCSAQEGNLSPRDFQNAMIDDGDFILLDVRTAPEIEQGVIQGAIHVDYYDASFVEKINDLDRKKTVYVYCASGGRSKMAAKKLNQSGFSDVINLNGGVRAWVASGLPLKKIDYGKL